MLDQEMQSLKVRAMCAPWRLARHLKLWSGTGARVQFVTESAEWAIRWLGEYIKEEVNVDDPGRMEVTSRPEKIVNRVVHFGSPHLWRMWGGAMSRSNRFIVSYFHGRVEDGEGYRRQIDTFLRSQSGLERIVTGASIMEKRLIDWGISPSKVVRIPIGVDTKMFCPPINDQRGSARRKLGIPEGMVLIGSFQKDGNGWGDGGEPKLIKGPDLFVAALVELKARGLPVMALLTGPSRGYIKCALASAGIPFRHLYVATHSQLVSCYHALDLYIIASREEGGPMALMESMASGVPVISSRVGMSIDLIETGINGFLVDIGDTAAIADHVLNLVESKYTGQIITNARQTALGVDWSVVASAHLQKVYRINSDINFSK